MGFFRLLPVFLLSLASLSAPTAVSAPAVPPGFEDLAGEQTTAVDVYFGNRFLLTTLADYTLDTLTFHDVEAVVSSIPNIKYRSLITNHLSGPINNHAELACGIRRREGCGRLTPDIAGIIFDESRFRVDIFIHPELLEEQQAFESRYLPDATADWSLVQNLNAAYSGSSATRDQYDINGTTIISRANRRGRALWHYNSDHQTQVEEITYEQDLDQHQLAVGLFRPFNNSLVFMEDEYLGGVSFQRSLYRRLDTDNLNASELKVFILNRSKVDIYKGTRLYDSRIYEAGQQTLDTSKLPNGAYLVDIIITEPNGEVFELTRFFVKTASLPPSGEPLYFMEAGQIFENNPDETIANATGEWILRSGYQERVNGDFGMGFSMAMAETHALAENSYTWYQPRFQAKTTLMASNQGDYGYDFNYNMRLKQWNLGLYHRRAWTRYNPGETERYQLIGQHQTRTLVNLGHPIGNGYFNASYEKSRIAGQPRQEGMNARYSLPILRSNRYSLNLVTEYTRQNSLDAAEISLLLSENRPHIRTTLQAGYDRQERLENNTLYLDNPTPPPALQSVITEDKVRENSGKARADLVWRDENWLPEELEAGAFAERNASSNLVGGHAYYSSLYGNFRLQTQRTDIRNDQENPVTTTSAVYSANLIANRDGVAWGGQHTNSTGVILSIDSDVPDAEFDVLVNGRAYSIARSGRSIPIALPPHRTYRISIRDRGNVLMAYDETPREVTLYPGNVEALHFTANRINIVYGRIIHHENICSFSLEEECFVMKAPLANALIKGVHGFNMTDEYGMFQAEITSDMKILEVRKRDTVCEVVIPDFEAVNGIANLGNLHCLPKAIPTSPE